MQIYPSLLAVFDKVGNDTKALISGALAAQKAGANGLHLDFMAPPACARTTFNISIINNLREDGIILPLDVHLMTGPEWIRKMPLNAIQSLTFHAKFNVSNQESVDLLTFVHEAGVEAGIAIDLDENIADLEHLLLHPACKRILLMTVQAGAGGQPFQPQALEKIKRIHKINDKTKIMVDGGINQTTPPLAKLAGAHAAVAGSSVYNSQDIELNIKNLRLAAV